MRPFTINIAAHPGATQTAMEVAMLDAFRELSDNSHLDNATQILRDFTVSNYTETRTLNAGTAATADIANFLCTLVSDLKAGGSKAER